MKTHTRYVIPVIDESEDMLRFGFRTVDMPILPDDATLEERQNQVFDASSVIKGYYKELGSTIGGTITVGPAIPSVDIAATLADLVTREDPGFKVSHVSEDDDGNAMIVVTPHPDMKKVAAKVTHVNRGGGAETPSQN